ncbi:uroporphyrinogen decarboxylase family protein [Candidatus Bathyarchaeota archaeon]|nr:uroporphyrinogen decarboxylase family protein [Candidatus Bathyarchaeota archaeon]
MMEGSIELTPRERVMEAIEHREPDLVPVAFLRSTYDATRLKLDVQKYLLDPKTKLNAQIELHKRFPDCAFIPSIYPDFGMVAEPSALGAEVRLYSDQPPKALSFVRSLEDIDALEVPDPYRDGLMPKVLEAYKYMIENSPKEYYVDPPFIMGPLCVASEIRGLSEVFSDMFKNPASLHRLLKVCTKTAIEYIRALEEISGGSDFVFLADDIAGLVSPRFAEEFFFNYMKKIYDSFSGKIRVYHNDAKTMHLLEQIADVGVQLFNFSFQNDLKQTKERIGRRVCLWGNVEPIGIFRSGKPEEIEEICRQKIEIAAPGGGFVLSTGAAVYGPDQSVDAVINAAKKYGRYPIGKLIDNE